MTRRYSCFEPSNRDLVGLSMLEDSQAEVWFDRRCFPKYLVA